jgi:hypothetical protein
MQKAHAEIFSVSEVNKAPSFPLRPRKLAQEISALANHCTFSLQRS